VPFTTLTEPPHGGAYFSGRAGGRYHSSGPVLPGRPAAKTWQEITPNFTRMILAKITGKLLCTVFFLDVTVNILLPKFSLLLWVLILMVADLVTGILKAKLTREKITSEKARRTIIKFLQYFGCLGLVVVMINQNHDNATFVEVMNWAKDGVTILILYIELLSVFENLYEMDKTSRMAIYFIRPIYWLLSLAVRSNPAKKAEEASNDKQKDDEP
jgi:phage-related holin